MLRVYQQALQWCLKGGVAFSVLVAVAGAGSPAQAAPPTLWVNQIGTTHYDYGNGIATDSHDNAVITGRTLGGFVAGKRRDVWVAKYDPLGHQTWMKWFGGGLDYGTSVATDKSDDIFVAGYGESDFFGPRKGGNDAFVVKFDPTGTLLWKRSIGTSAFFEQANGVAVDGAGSVIICGYTTGQIGQNAFGAYDAWIAKYDAAGKLQWTRQLGTSQNDYCNGVATDTFNNVILAGKTAGPLGGPDPANTGYAPWIAKYDPRGNLVWVHQVITIGKQVSGDCVATDKDDNILVGGTSNGRVVPGPYQGFDAWVAKYNAAGYKVWIREYGTRYNNDLATGVAADPQGNVLLTGGVTHTPLPTTDPEDAFVRKYSPTGGVIWTRAFGSSERDVGHAVTTDSIGDVYVAGVTFGDLGGPNQRGSDAFLAKIAK